ncbi:MAG: hypothetical protein ABEJ75_02010 [Candidatus Nanohaloarchaea archaeon]
MELYRTMAVVAVIGLVAGVATASFTMKDEQKYYNRVEDRIMQNKTFNGTVDCFSPREINVNVSEKVENAADVRAICRHSYRGNVQWFTIAFSN